MQIHFWLGVELYKGISNYPEMSGCSNFIFLVLMDVRLMPY